MGKIYVRTGDGQGKTTSALGTALRAAGHKKKTVIVQFLKGRGDVGEVKISSALGDYYTIRQFGKKDFVDLSNPTHRDKSMAAEGLKYAYEALQKKPFLLVLDEINLAARHGFVSVKDVIALLSHVPRETNVILTGRDAPKEFLEKADFVSKILDIKSISGDATQGLEF